MKITYNQLKDRGFYYFELNKFLNMLNGTNIKKLEKMSDLKRFLLETIEFEYTLELQKFILQSGQINSFYSLWDKGIMPWFSMREFI